MREDVYTIRTNMEAEVISVMTPLDTSVLHLRRFVVVDYF